MRSQQYEAVRAHQASLRREVAQDRLARAASEQSSPRLSVLIMRMCSALARRFSVVSSREQRPVGAEVAG
jgi:hypothetical protein